MGSKIDKIDAALARYYRATKQGRSFAIDAVVPYGPSTVVMFTRTFPALGATLTERRVAVFDAKTDLKHDVIADS